MSGDDWPPLSHPHTRRRLAAPNDQLLTFLPEMLELMPRIVDSTETPEEWVELALSYPWERPTEACLIRDGEVLPDGEIDDGLRRHAVLAFGANASPPRLALKFEGVEPHTMRLVPGELADHDVCALPSPGGFGSFAGVLVRSPGTRVRVALTWLTELQIEMLVLSEFGYGFGRLEGIELRTDDGVVHGSVLAFSGRLGAYAREGAPVALAAIPAADRRFPALTQEELLDDCAERLGIAGGRNALHTRLREDLAGAAAEWFGRLLAEALPAPLDGWVPHPLH